MENQSATDMTFDVAHDLVNDVLNRLVKDIKSINLDMRGAKSRICKLVELDDMNNLLKKTYEHINEIIATEQNVITDMINEEAELINTYRKTLNLSSKAKSKSSPVAEIKPPKPKLEEIINKTITKTMAKNISWADDEPVPEKPKQFVAKLNAKVQVKREIAPGVFINTYDIDKDNECHNYKGYWCWSDRLRRFYISINDNILECITTDILADDIQPIKFHEHIQTQKNEMCNELESNWFIPREYNARFHKAPSKETDDIRILNNKIKYLPSNKLPGPYDKYAYRIGSKSNLRQDLSAINVSEIRLYRDMVGNHMLILTAVANEIKNRKKV